MRILSLSENISSLEMETFRLTVVTADRSETPIPGVFFSLTL